MKTIVKLALFAAVAASLSGCAMAHPGIVNGAVYSGYELGSSAGPATGTASEGKACAMSILGVVGIGDASVGAAMEAGGVKKVATVDHKAMNVLGIYGQVCTVVKGE